MDQDKRMAEMEELLREIVDGTQLPGWMKRADAVLAPPPDPDGGAKEVERVFYQALYDVGNSAMQIVGYRAVAAWADKRVRDARIAALEEARKHVCGAGWRQATLEIDTLLAKAEEQS